MNYDRIYSDFIASRRKKQKALIEAGGYIEKHHIVPISLGGGNENGNLISLSARDHYFAHCCLAKVHGGKMWSALFSMSNMTKVDPSSRYFLKGRLVEMARRQAAIVRRENMTHLWATGEFTREREYGPISEAHRDALREAHTGRQKSPDSIAKAGRTKRAAAKEFVFHHSETGQVYRGTQAEFCLFSGVGQALASCLTRGKILSAKLWVLDGAPTTAIHGRDSTIRRFRNLDGAIFVGTTYQFRMKYSLDSGVISNLVNGKNRVKSFKGWRIEIP